MLTLIFSTNILQEPTNLCLYFRRSSVKPSKPDDPKSSKRLLQFSSPTFYKTWHAGSCGVSIVKWTIYSPSSEILEARDCVICLLWSFVLRLCSCPISEAKILTLSLIKKIELARAYHSHHAFDGRPSLFLIILLSINPQCNLHYWWWQRYSITTTIHVTLLTTLIWYHRVKSSTRNKIQS